MSHYHLMKARETINGMNGFTEADGFEERRKRAKRKRAVFELEYDPEDEDDGII